MANKSKDPDLNGPDISLIRNPIQISGKPIEQVLKSVHYGSPELRCLLLDECDLIFECKVCRALFRDLPNFISHKRAFCTKSSLENRHVTIASLPEEKVVVIHPQAPEDTEETAKHNKDAASKHVKPPKPTLNETIQRIQSGELGKSLAYKVYTEAAEKLQSQKEGMKIATIRTTAIPTNKNAVFMDVTSTSVNIHERLQQQNSSGPALPSSLEPSRPDASMPAKARKTSERISTSAGSRSPRHSRKPNKQEKHATEPQKLLMEQLKEIQHKVKQKAASQEPSHYHVKGKPKTGNATGSKEDQVVITKDVAVKVETTGSKDDQVLVTKDVHIKAENAASKDEVEGTHRIDLSALARQNFQSLLAKEENKAHTKKRVEVPKIADKAIVKRRGNKAQSTTAKTNSTEMAKDLVKMSSRMRASKNSLTCGRCNSIFSSRRSLNFHNSIHHSPKRIFYQCPYCSSAFYYFFGITRHLFNNHSKTTEEIDGMRQMLRDKAVTKPAPPPRQSNELNERCDSRRRIRCSLAISDAVSNSTSEGPVARTKSKEDKHPSKNIGGSQKALTANGENEPSKQPGKGSQSDEKDSKKVPLNVSTGSDSSGITVSALPSPAPSSVKSEDGSEVSRVCSKCQRSFGRKISYENHIKICQADSSSVKDQDDRQNSGKCNISENNSKDLKIKPKRQSNSFHSTKIVEGKGVGTRSKKKDVSEENDNKPLSVVSPGTDDTLRSASADRDLSPRTRNQSQERKDTVKAKRDSSVESTQSNMETGSSRSRRVVSSKYGSDALQNSVAKIVKSPAKLGNQLSPGSTEAMATRSPGKSNLTLTSQESGTNNPPRPTKTYGVSLHEKNSSNKSVAKLMANKTSYTVTNIKKKRLSDILPKSADRGSFVRSDVKQVSGCPQKTYFAPRHQSFPCSSLQKSKDELPTDSTPQSTLSPVSSTNQAMDLNSQRKAPTPAVTSTESENITKIKTLPSPQIEKIEAPVLFDKEFAFGDTNLILKLEGKSVSSHQINSSLGASGNVKNLLEKDVENLKTDNLTPNEEIWFQSNDSDKPKEDLKSIVNQEKEVSSVVPATALSERPRRKRKVPSRSIDAKEMLSKIHQHYRSDVPMKKPRLADKSSENVKKRDSLATGLSKVEPPSNKTQREPKEVVSSKKDGRKAKDLTRRADNDEEEDMVKGQSRVVTNRIYVWKEKTSKSRAVKCYDFSKLTKIIDAEKIKCLSCGEVFTQLCNLRRHVIRQHFKWSRFKCKLCKYKSYDKSECSTHILRKHQIVTHRRGQAINSLIVDLVKGKSLKKEKAAHGNQKSESTDNIYARPTVRKIPRLPERVWDKNVSGTSDNEPTKQSVLDSELIETKKIYSSPLSSTVASKSEGSLKSRARKNQPFNISTRNSPRTYDISPFGPSKVKMRGKVGAGRGRTSMTLTTVINKKTDETLQEKKPASGVADTQEWEDASESNIQDDAARSRNIFEKMRRESTSSLSSERSSETDSARSFRIVHIAEDQCGKSASSLDGQPVRARIITQQYSTVQSSSSKSPPVVGTDFIMSPQSLAQRKSIGGYIVSDNKSSPPTKPPVKYFITTTVGPTKAVEKTSKDSLVHDSVSQKQRHSSGENSSALSPQVTKSLLKYKKMGDNIISPPVNLPQKQKESDSSPALSDQLAKSLMKLKKLGDSMSSSSTPTQKAASNMTATSSNSQGDKRTQGTSSVQMAKSTTGSGTTSQVIPVFTISSAPKPDSTQAKTSSVPSLKTTTAIKPGTTSAPSFVLSHGSSGKIIVYTHSADETQSSAVPLNCLPASSMSTITVRSKDSSSSTPTGTDEDALPSGTFVIHQHFL